MHAQSWLVRVAPLMSPTRHLGGVKTLRFRLPVLDLDDVDQLLEFVTDVDGVMAALVDAAAAEIDVVVSSEASALLVREEVHQALLAGWNGVAAA